MQDCYKLFAPTVRCVRWRLAPFQSSRCSNQTSRLWRVALQVMGAPAGAGLQFLSILVNAICSDVSPERHE